jgi:hypothetical protein
MAIRLQKVKLQEVRNKSFRIKQAGLTLEKGTYRQRDDLVGILSSLKGRKVDPCFMVHTDRKLVRRHFLVLI